MTKRACPFDTNIYRQMKIHVNTYEYDSTALKAVHESTLKRLILGSVCNSSYRKSEHVSEVTPEKSTKKEKQWKQKQVTNYFLNNCKKSSNEIKNSPSQEPDVQGICSYCDLKSECIYCCVRCLENYCQSCSFANKDNAKTTDF